MMEEPAAKGSNDDVEFDDVEHLEEVPEFDLEGDSGGMISYIQQFLEAKNTICVQLMNAFAKSAGGKTGKIPRKKFEKQLSILLASEKKEKPLLGKITSKVFDAFDRDGDGFVDTKEFMAGMTLIMGGCSEKKLKLSFSLFDLDGDGQISLEEMTTYLTSFFEVCFNLEPAYRDRFLKPDGKHYSARDVAESTAMDCFNFADKNRDGHVTYNEFKTWFCSDGRSQGPSTFGKAIITTQIRSSSVETA
mmetsp:Transcript_14944/g.26863  ORF Transcript_14944/g.26863 Transcript_14944/m.26863 type:complete len:247 (+) Transcript_14944:140-880(+)